MQELYKKFRPKDLKEMAGQKEAIASLYGFQKKNNIPHAVLLTGPSGCGKTTIARILAGWVGCGEFDLSEINCADARGIDDIRSIRSGSSLMALSGKSKVFILDECHRLTSDAQSMLLKLLEDGHKHVYYFLATTDPVKLLPTIKTRCSEVKLKSLSTPEMTSVVNRVLKKEKASISEEVMEKLVEKGEGSPRKVLVLLEQILAVEDEETQLHLLNSADAETQGINLAKAIIKPGVQWKEIAGIIKNLTEEPETVRRIVLGYANAMLLIGNKMAPRYYAIIVAFRENYFDMGKAGLTMSCWEIVNNK